MLAIVGGALGVLIASSTVSLVKSLASVEAPGVFRYAFSVSILPRVKEIGFSLKMFGVAFGSLRRRACCSGFSLPCSCRTRERH